MEGGGEGEGGEEGAADHSSQSLGGGKAALDPLRGAVVDAAQDAAVGPHIDRPVVRLLSQDLGCRVEGGPHLPTRAADELVARAKISHLEEGMGEKGEFKSES